MISRRPRGPARRARAEPSFVMYDLSARFAAAASCRAARRRPLARRDAMLAAIAEHRPAVVWLAYPNNPTGNCFDRAAIERILEAAPGLVVLDEAYQPFALDTWMPRCRVHPTWS
jgi:histidinol-phosphate aminotransferase